MSWKPEADEIERRRALAREMGGPEAVAKQHERGRLTVRERIERLADAGSFHEQGPLAGHAERDADGNLLAFSPANYVLGFARVDGRPVVMGGEDFTQRGGSPSPAGLRKSVYAEDLACHYRLPLIRFLEGGGGSVAGAAGNARRPGAAPPPRPAPDPAFGAPRFLSIARILRVAPVCSAALGAVAGFPAARLAASHFSVMTRDTSQVLIGGPALVERALGEQLTKEELGGARVHARSGVVDNVARDEDDAFLQMRRFLSYLPTHVAQLPPVATPDDDPSRCEESLLEIVPRDRRKIYKMRRLLEMVLDRGSLFETTAGYGRSQITALARVDGRPVGVLANDPAIYAGSMDAEGAQKVRRFVDLCETFHLPILSFVDEPGFMIGAGSEAAATIRYGSRRDRRGGAVDGSLGLGARPKGLRGRGRRALRPSRHGIGVAVGRERGAAPGGRRGGRLPARDRGRRRPRGEAARARGEARPRSLAVSARRGIRCSRSDRSAAYAARPVRMARLGAAPARAPTPPLAARVTRMAIGPDSLSLAGRTAVVTGAAMGLGAAIAHAFARCGADLEVCDRDAEALARTAEALADHGGRVATAVLDVRDGEAVQGFFAAAAQRAGVLHVLVNNAGGTFQAAFERLSPGGERALVDENWTSVTHCVRAALPHLARGAAIINVTSIEAHRAGPGYAVYSAMKAAVASLTRSLALELGDRCIRVNCIAPDVIPTPGLAGLESAPVKTPLARRGHPDDVAGAALFLASDLARFVSGTTLHVDGGNHAAGGWRRRDDGSFAP